MAEPPITNGFDSRVERLEEQVEGIATAVGELTAESRATNANLNTLTNLVREQAAVTRELSRPRPMNWGWVLGGVSALGAFILLYTRPIEASGGETKARVHELERDRLDVAEWRGEVKARLKNLEATP